MNRLSRTVAIAMAVAFLCQSASHAVVTTRKLVASDGQFADSFGFSVATDGQTIIVGARDFGSPGAAYLFNAHTGEQLAKLAPSITTINQEFGRSVAIDGTKAIVGFDTGAYLFDFSNLSQITRTRIIPVGLTTGRAVSVDISGNTVIVGDNDDNRLGSFTGAAYLFDATTGAQLAKLIASDGEARDNFGIDVAIDGATAIVGSVRGDGFNGIDNGAVYQYDVLTGPSLRSEVVKYFVPGQSDANSSFGYSLDLNGGNILASEARLQTYLWPLGGVPAPLPSSNWNHSFSNYTGLDDELAVVGFYGQEAGFHPPESAGIYRVSTGKLVRKLVGDTPNGNDGFGISAHVSNGVVVVGAISANDGKGAAYVFYVPEPTCLAIVYPTAIVSWRRLSRRRTSRQKTPRTPLLQTHVGV